MCLSTTKGALRRGPLLCKPAPCLRSPLFRTWRRRRWPVLPQLVRWTWPALLPVLTLCPGRKGHFLLRRSQLWRHEAWFRFHFCHSWAVGVWTSFSASLSLFPGCGLAMSGGVCLHSGCSVFSRHGRTGGLGPVSWWSGKFEPEKPNPCRRQHVDNFF